MRFIKFSLHDSKMLELVEKYLDYKVTLGYYVNENEGIANFKFVVTPTGENQVKISYTELESTSIPLHYHKNTKHVYACLDGAINLHIAGKEADDSKNYVLFRDEGCFIPPKIPHGLSAEEARLLCLEIPPDEDDFYQINAEG